MKINSLYICVNDMERAIDFYEHFFNQQVDITDSIYSIFIINGFRFGMFAYQEMAETHLFGNNCLPSFEISEIIRVEEVLTHYGCPIVFPLTKIGENMVFEFQDIEGNHIEVTYPVSLQINSGDR